MQVLIQFTRNGCHTVLGNFGPGDRIRCAPDMAQHFVEGVKCARYVDQPAPVAAVVVPAKPARRRRVSATNGQTPGSQLD